MQPLVGAWSGEIVAVAGARGSNIKDDDGLGGEVFVRTDVLFTHFPPTGHLDDGGKFVRSWRAEIWRARPTVVVYGHIDASKGKE